MFMKRLYTLILILFSIQALLVAQSNETEAIGTIPPFKIGITTGAAFFNETDLEKINADLVQSMPFKVETIDNFPPYRSFGGYILTPLAEKIWFGLSYQYYTTGSRLGAKDFSASYSFDQIISSHSLGFLADFTLLKIKKAELFFETTAGVHFATWKIEENLNMGEQIEKSVEQLKATIPFVYPGLKLSYPITKNVGIAVLGGYSLDIYEKYHLESNNKAKPDKQASFSGARLSVALEFQLNTLNK